MDRTTGGSFINVEEDDDEVVVDDNNDLEGDAFDVDTKEEAAASTKDAPVDSSKSN
jgi:hypothetical protein